MLGELEQLNRHLDEFDTNMAGKIGDIEKHLKKLLSEIETSSKSLQEPVERIWGRMDEGLLDISKELESLRYELRGFGNEVGALSHRLETAFLQANRNYHLWFLLLVVLLAALVYRLW